MARRVILVGIGGPSCSGKTTLARHIMNVLPEASLYHQDDFAPPEEQIPVHPIHNVKDWDDPETAVEWDVFRNTISDLKSGKQIPASDKSHIHLNLLTSVDIAQDILKKWRDRFRTALQLSNPPRIILVDGFLLYWDRITRDMFDVRVFIREDKDILKHRRNERNERIADDSFWKDPPGVFDNIVWPAYVKANAPLFVNSDIESGAHRADAGLLLLEAKELNMSDMFERVCAELDERIKDVQ